MIKSAILIFCALIFLVINTIILFLKPEFNFALNDDDSYCVIYQKWISTAVFMGGFIVALISIYFAVNYSYFISSSFFSVECIITAIYALVKYKGVTVCGDKIKVERLFVSELNCKFKDITKVIFIPNAKVIVYLKNKKNFEVSFNSENFHKFYNSLIKEDVKFKTTKVPSDENHIFLKEFNMTILFPKTMFREYYQSKTFFRNSNYLFSARSLENYEYIEGYQKKSDKQVEDFIEIVENDLKINGFKSQKVETKILDDYDFKVIKADNKNDKTRKRAAYIYKGKYSYLVIYADYNKDDEEKFILKFDESIKKPVYIDSKNPISRV